MTRLLLTLGVITFATLAFSSSDPPLFSSEFIWDYLEGSFDQRRNLALLPFSIRLGMTMLANTVSDRYTLKQMIEKLHLPNSITRATERHRRKLTQLQLDKHFTYATKIIVFGTDSLNPKLLQTAENFNASIDHHPKLDLKVIPSVVNRWAKNVTSGMTSAVLMSNDLLPDTRMILLSVASFACKWEHQFNVNSSKMDMFNAYPIGKLFMTNFMNLGPTLLPVTLNNDLNIQAIELPFEKDSDYSFMIIMPRQTDGNMTEMVERLNNGAFRHLYDSLIPMKISVKMPRFTISTSVNVNSVLRRLQLTAPFQWSTFQIFKNEKLTLDKVKQSVTVQVDEKGVRAAAVSKFSIVGRSVPMSFNVDRPFVFAIIKQSVRFPLFVGHYAYPTKTPPIRP